MVKHHPFLVLGSEYDEAVGCLSCMKISKREEWEVNGWSCPVERCIGDAGDVYPPERIELLKNPDRGV